MEKFEEFEHRIKRALNNMDAKISYLHDSTGQLKNSFGEFQEEMDEFIGEGACLRQQIFYPEIQMPNVRVGRAS